MNSKSPILDMLIPPYAVAPLPNVADNFPADAFVSRIFVGHDALRRGDDRDPESAEYFRNFVVSERTRVNPA